MTLNKRIIILVACIVVAVSIFGYLYASLSGELRRKSFEYKALQSQLKDAKLKMRIAYKFQEAGFDSDFTNRILANSDLPRVLNGFMRVGRECGVSLPAITPHETQAALGLNDVIRIPITIEVRSKCRNLGEFLANLIKELGRAMAQVDVIEVKKAEPASEGKLEARVELSLYARK